MVKDNDQEENGYMCVYGWVPSPLVHKDTVYSSITSSLDFTGRAAVLLHTSSISDVYRGSSCICFCLLYSLDLYNNSLREGRKLGARVKNAGRWQIPNLTLFLQVSGGCTILQISRARVQWSLRLSTHLDIHIGTYRYTLKSLTGDLELLLLPAWWTDEALGSLSWT